MADGEARPDLSKYFADSVNAASDFDEIFDSSVGASPPSMSGVPAVREPTKVVTFVEPDETVGEVMADDASLSPTFGLTPGSPLGQTAVMKSCVGDMASLADTDAEEAQEAGTLVSQTLSASVPEVSLQRTPPQVYSLYA
jgi:hypothetical protein